MNRRGFLKGLAATLALSAAPIALTAYADSKKPQVYVDGVKIGSIDEWVNLGNGKNYQCYTLEVRGFDLSTYEFTWTKEV